MRAEIVAVGTELLLGHVVDTNSSQMGEMLAASGIDCVFQTRVGDNHGRIVDAIKIALSRADAVILCGGLGPTQDDITREALAEVMGVELFRDPAVLALVEEVFASRNIVMSPSNAQQADVPVGASIIPQVRGTAPGLICPIGDQVMYAVPGVPDEMVEMMERAVLPDLRQRSGTSAIITSRTLRTWGLGEAVLAETIAGRLEELDRRGPGAPTIAFLASGVEGIKVRLTVKTADDASAKEMLDAEEAAIRELLGDIVFGVDDETMEAAVGKLLVVKGQTLAAAESFTGGLIAARIVAVPGASEWFTGGVVAYQSSVKFRLLEVTEGPVVSESAAAEMAEGVRRLLGADVGISTTGVAGPTAQDGVEPGTVFVGFALAGQPASGHLLRLRGGRNRIRETGTIAALDALRHQLLAAH